MKTWYTSLINISDIDPRIAFLTALNDYRTIGELKYQQQKYGWSEIGGDFIANKGQFRFIYIKITQTKAHVLHMGCPLKQWAAQWTGAAHYLCKLIIISAHGLHMGSSVDRSCPLTSNLFIISYHWLPIGSSDCYVTKWAVPTLKLYCRYEYTKPCMINRIWGLKQLWLHVNGHAWFHSKRLRWPFQKG